MKKKILIILALVLVISVLCCTVAVAEEISTEQPENDETVIVPEDTPEEENGESSITDKIQDAGSEALSWAYVAVGGMSGFVGLIVSVLLGSVGTKLKQSILKAKEQNTDILVLKSSFNDMVDEMNILKEILDSIKSENGDALSSIITKLKTADGKNDALFKTLATLINYSNLPDASKENLLGEMNSALGYTKSEVSSDEKVD